MSYFGVSLRNGVSLGLGTVPALSNPPLLYRLAPSLLLQFAGAETLDSRVTFTRTTTATRTNSSGLIESVAINGPRFDYNPTTLAPNGLLIEEQRTNSIRNNTGVGAVAGTPGTLPTNWSVSSGGSGITRTLVGTGTENGITYVEFQFSGTGSGSAFQIINTDTITGIAAATGQAWSGSFYLKLVAGSTTGTDIKMQLLELNSVGSGVVQNLSPVLTPTSASLITQRNTLTATLSGGVTVTNLQQGLRLLFTNAVAVNITLRIGLPQLELGAFPTSVIPTSAAAATRTADVATMTGTNFSSWYNATEGTLYASYSIPFDSSVSAFALVAPIADGTFSNTIAPYVRTLDDTQRSAVRVGGVAQTDLTSGGTYVYGTTAKLATAYKVNDFAMSANGAAVAVDTSGTVPVVDRMGLGGNSVTGGSLSYLNGTIKQIAFFPRRLANAELQSITA